MGALKNVLGIRLLLFAALAFALVALFSFGHIAHVNFEDPPAARWEGPRGGGAHGGAGAGSLSREYTRSGKRAMKLEVWDDGSDQAIAWAGVTHTMPCPASGRVEAESWIYFSSTQAPLGKTAAVHLQIEFFRDAAGEDLIPQHVCVSPPVNPETHPLDQWHRIEVKSRIPAEAKSLRAGVLVTAQRLQRRKQAVWVDDLRVETHERGPTAVSLCPSWDSSHVRHMSGESGNHIAVSTLSRYK